MVRQFTNLVIQDYARFRSGFASFEPVRERAGLTNAKIYRNAEDPNDLLVCFDISDIAKSRELMESEKLRQGLADAGVIRLVSYSYAE